MASTTLTDPKRADTTVLSGDLAAGIGELKAKPGGELQVHGSGTLTRWLLDNDLVDEMNLLVCPVVAGQGTRLFPGTGLDMTLDLVDHEIEIGRDDLLVLAPSLYVWPHVRSIAAVALLRLGPSRTSTQT